MAGVDHSLCDSGKDRKDHPIQITCMDARNQTAVASAPGANAFVNTVADGRVFALIPSLRVLHQFPYVSEVIGIHGRHAALLRFPQIQWQFIWRHARTASSAIQNQRVADSKHNHLIAIEPYRGSPCDPGANFE
jgi:hypothetical protein